MYRAKRIITSKTNMMITITNRMMGKSCPPLSSFPVGVISEADGVGVCSVGVEEGNGVFVGDNVDAGNGVAVAVGVSWLVGVIARVSSLVGVAVGVGAAGSMRNKAIIKRSSYPGYSERARYAEIVTYTRALLTW